MSFATCFRHSLFASATAAALIVGAMLLIACGTPIETPIPIRLSVAADRSALPLANDLAAAYHAAQPHISIDVEPMGNALAAERALSEGHADLALSTAQPDPENLIPLRAQVIAQEAVALIVHPDNPLAGLDLAQARAIFHGDLRDWSQLEGESSAIQVVTREPQSGPRAALDADVLDGQTLSPMAIVVPGDQEVLDLVAADRAAIGYVAADWLDGRVKVLEINGFSQQAGRHQPGAYPIMLPIYLLSSDMPTTDVVEFQRFVQSREGQRVIARHDASATDRP